MRILIISIPLISSLSLMMLGRNIGDKGGKIISIGSIIISTIISLISLKEYLKGQIITLKIKEWFNIGILKSEIEFIYDKESIIMMNLISIITIIVIIYSYWYLEKDAHINIFVGKLLIFAVAMYILVSAKNYLVSFLGWEGVGIISFLLINFWATAIQNSKSALKAIIFNKIGDVFYLLAMMILSISNNTYDYNNINYFNHEGIKHIGEYTISIISICLIIAAMAKSAQIILHCWLGDAMAGPTPVSALLHAATMVTAGIYIIIRSKWMILESLENIQEIILIIGSLTILFAGLSSLSQYDIKKVIAYSTCAQIGFMFFALSMFKPFDSSLYHLITHGFFKALLFLSSGLIIHNLLLEQDLRKYGNLIFKAPLFYLFFLIGTFAIIAFPSYSGYYSKDLILLHSLNLSKFFIILLIIGSLLSSLYSFKLLYYTFFNLSSSSHTFFFKYHSLNSYYFLFPFLFLLLGSITLGWCTTSFFSSPETLNISLESTVSSDLYYTPGGITFSGFKLLLFLLPFFAILILFLFYTYIKNPFYHSFILFILPVTTRRFLFDTFYNYFILKPTFFLSYHISFKSLDRGFLEYLGPLSLFRLFFYFPRNYNMSNQYLINYPFLFFYFFISLIIILLFLFITSPYYY